MTGPKTGGRSTYTSEKISLRGDALLGYCRAGEESVHITAKHLLSVKRFHPEDELRGQLLVAIRKAQQECKGTGLSFLDGHILAVHKTLNGLRLWFAVVSETPRVNCIQDKVIAGDFRNGASFFAEMYFPKGKPLPTIEELLPLATHSVLMAGRLNPGGIGGLEIVVFTGSKTHKLTDKEIGTPDRRIKSFGRAHCKCFGTEAVGQPREKM